MLSDWYFKKLLVYVKFVLRTIIYHERVYFLQVLTTFSLVFPVMRMNSIPPLFSALSVAPTCVWSAQSKLTQREHSPNTSEYQSRKSPRRTQSAPSIQCIWSSLPVLRRSVRTLLWCVTSVKTMGGMSNTGWDFRGEIERVELGARL